MCRSMLLSPLIVLSPLQSVYPKDAVGGQSQPHNLADVKNVNNGLKKNIISVNGNSDTHHTHKPIQIKCAHWLITIKAMYNTESMNIVQG